MAPQRDVQLAESSGSFQTGPTFQPTLPYPKASRSPSRTPLAGWKGVSSITAKSKNRRRPIDGTSPQGISRRHGRAGERHRRGERPRRRHNRKCGRRCLPLKPAAGQIVHLRHSRMSSAGETGLAIGPFRRIAHLREPRASLCNRQAGKLRTRSGFDYCIPSSSTTMPFAGTV